jgi:hypothetical protein
MRMLIAITICLSASPAYADFIRPKVAGEPLIYGVEGGLAVAVHPAALDGRPQGGPRGLLRIGYQEQGRFHLINYIAIEPVVGTVMGLSELERGGDNKPGKRFWVGDDLTDGGIGLNGNTRGRIRSTPDGRVLTFVVHVELFVNGARPLVEISLFERQPQRVRLRVYSHKDGKSMARCALTATMGNQSRCRHLWLKSETRYAPSHYAGYTGTDFTETRPYDLDSLFRTKTGDVVAAISPDEFEPREVWPFPNNFWHHDGRWMAQFWLKPKGSFDDFLQCRVNGRRTYWAGKQPIPGGLSFENFEFREPFQDGREYWFGYTTQSPAKEFGFPYDAAPTAVRRNIPQGECQALTMAGPLINGSFADGLTGWQREGDDCFTTRIADGKPFATSQWRAGQGRIYQCWKVPKDADTLAFTLSGVADAASCNVALWNGQTLVRRMTAAEGREHFRVRWDLAGVRGKTVTLELVDRIRAADRSLSVSGFELTKPVNRDR